MTFTASFIVLRSDSFHFRILKSLFFLFALPRVLPLETVSSRRLLHLFGTDCWSQYEHHRYCQFSAVV